MKSTRGRRLNLGDGLFIVAATAFGISVVREPIQGFFSAGMTRFNFDATFPEYMIVIVPSWFVWTVAVLTIRLRQPRPDLRRLCRQPGFTAVLSASICAFFLLGFQLFLSLRRGPSSWPFLPSSYFLVWPIHVAPAVIGVWVIMVFSRRCKPEKSLIDSLGIVLGLGWVLLDLAEFLFWPYYIR